MLSCVGMEGREASLSCGPLEEHFLLQAQEVGLSGGSERAKRFLP